MSDATVQTIIGSLPATIAAIVAAVVAIAGLVQNRRNAAIAKRTEAMADKIHTVTNSAKSAVDKQLKEANDKIAALNLMVGKLIEAKKEKAP